MGEPRIFAPKFEEMQLVGLLVQHVEALAMIADSRHRGGDRH
jgi:hypothetical protein